MLYSLIPMKCNISFLDRILRFLIGVVLSTWAFSGGPTWSYLGVYLIFTSGWGFCIFYAFFKINTIKELKSKNHIMSAPNNEL